jgi:putative FmdB family regulatory protein
MFNEWSMSMPNYDYYCTQCGHQEEFLQKMTDAPLTACPQCQHPTFKRKFGVGSGLQFQGSGFYCTDYSSKSPLEKAPEPVAKGCGCGKSSCSA